MNKHKDSCFYHSCIKTPLKLPSSSSYEQIEKYSENCNKNRQINFISKSLIDDKFINEDISNFINDSNYDSFLLNFFDSIPDYDEINHLSNEQFKQKLDYFKRKQRILLKKLNNCLDQHENIPSVSHKFKQCNDNFNDNDDYENEKGLKLLGKKYNIKDSSRNSPILFAGLAADQDFLTYKSRNKDKALKTIRNNEIYSAEKSWCSWSGSNSSDSVKSDSENSIETTSLPPNSPKRWHPNLPRPFSFTLRNEIESKGENINKPLTLIKKKKKKKARPIPLTSRIPLYDKLVAAKKERSRIIRQESAWSLMSQVKPFKLECDIRAEKAMSRSSPELCTKINQTTSTAAVPPQSSTSFSSSSSSLTLSSKFKAKPVPKNLFNTDIYDKMMEDEYFRQIQKKIRAAELMKTSHLPPSMAKRERIKSTLNMTKRNCMINELNNNSSNARQSATISERSRSILTDLSGRRNNLAAILRCQAARNKLEKEICEKMEEKAKDYAFKIRESEISRKPAWKALRHAAKDVTKDLDFRMSLRKDEAREQAERHRLEMEMMLERVTRIPTLFERHSESFQAIQQLESRAFKLKKKIFNTKKKIKSQESIPPNQKGIILMSNLNNYSSSTVSSKSSSSRQSSSDFTEKKIIIDSLGSKKRVSINDTAEFIHNENNNNNNNNNDYGDTDDDDGKN